MKASKRNEQIVKNEKKNYGPIKTYRDFLKNGKIPIL